MLNKKILEDYLSFNRRDRMAVVCLLGLVALFYWLPEFIDPDQPEQLPIKEMFLAFEDSLQQEDRPFEKHETARGPGQQNNRNNAALFHFDPNTISEVEWQRLGLSERTAKTIEKFKMKGGRFYKPEDLQKIWGLPPGFYDRVKDYIRIDLPKPSFPDREPGLYVKEKVIKQVDINVADSSDWEQLPGIGGRLSSRILQFRKRLGGFYSIEQVKETYGLADSVFQKIRPFLTGGGEVQKININKATKEELRGHPYLRWKVADAIVAYREQHGNYAGVDDLLKIMLIDEAMLNRIRPYLAAE